ncbi:MAG TPA: cupin domain-containing protein [Candidatus Limnocylindria bacterium]|nr:cupin domain-containing protein [Candidatus Limnocylindria bacterium]
MRVVHIGAAGRERSPNPIFKGEVDSQTAVGEDVSRDLRLSEIHFRNGAVNRWHTHTCDQILIVTEGEGIVADEKEQRVVGRGDVAFIPANTRHWHGAKPGKDMTHWSILADGTTTIAE